MQAAYFTFPLMVSNSANEIHFHRNGTSPAVDAGTAVLMAILLTASAAAGISPSSRQRAITAFKRAEEMRVGLEGRSESHRTVAEYEKVIQAYKLVYRLDIAYVKTPQALGEAGALYDEMGRLFSNDQYFANAIENYQFLIHEYPYGIAARDALFTIAEIYLNDLANPDAARDTFNNFIARYPNTPQSARAKKLMQQIDARLTRRTPPAPVQRHPAAPASSPTLGLAEVNSIRHWVGPNYSRIVISAENEVKFNASRLINPPRLVFDLDGTRLSPALAGKSFPVEDGFLRQIRVGQFKPNVTRIVLDVKKIEEYSVFSLPSPFRLVIDIHGNSGSGSESETDVIAGQRLPRPVKTLPAPSSTHAEPTISRPVQQARVQQPAGSWGTPPGREPAGPQGDNPAQVASADSGTPKNPLVSNPTDSGGSEVVTPAQAGQAGPGAQQTLTRALGLKIARIVIDPGHGGHDTGTIGPSGLREKDVVLDVALRLRKLIVRRMGSEVIMTRHDDTFIPLEERTAIANEKSADLFISIHANASRDSEARGIETYYLNFTSDPAALALAARENASSQESVHQLQSLIQKIALSEKIEESRQFARTMDRSVARQLAADGARQPDRGVKKAPFVVLIGANMPSILTEISFLTNPHDERLLRRAQYRQKIAEAIFQGTLKYVNTLGSVKVAEDRKAPLSVYPKASF
jgi:N-acetylmuramoyl-L-alanine amidase